MSHFLNRHQFSPITGTILPNDTILAIRQIQEVEGDMYCRKCGNIVGSHSKRCHVCGYPPERIPELSATLSVLIPGLGQIYNFDINKGIILLIFGIIIILLIILLTKYAVAELDDIRRSLYVVYLVYIILCSFDAYKDAVYKND